MKILLVLFEFQLRKLCFMGDRIKAIKELQSESSYLHQQLCQYSDRLAVFQHASFTVYKWQENESSINLTPIFHFIPILLLMMSDLHL